MCQFDEQIVPFTGQLNVKQYIKGKPTPYGIKIYALCGKSGLLYDFLLYQGSTTEIDPSFLTCFGQGPAVVLHLTNENLLNKNHSLFFDNFFSSYKLFEALKSHNIKAAGTVRLDRFGMVNKKKNIDSRPPLRSEQELKQCGRGTTDEISSFDKKIALVSWYDNKCVNLASNFVASGIPQKARRWDKFSKEYVEVELPEVISLYNNNMGGVDKFNQLLSYYRIFTKSKKWTLRMITHAIDMAIVNSWLEYKQAASKHTLPKKEMYDLLHFRMEISNHLVNVGQMANIRRKRGRPSSLPQSPAQCTSRQFSRGETRPSSEVRGDKVDHLPRFDDKADTTRCKFPKCKGKTHFYCVKCNVHLCLGRNKDCFLLFHTQ